METRANHLLIGSFVIVLIIACVNFAFWMQKGGVDNRTKDYVIYFTGSVGGLTRASQVLFNGIRIGRVHEVQIDEKDTRRVKVIVRINERAPIRVNSQAQLVQQPLTGISGVHITPGSIDEPLISTAKSGDLTEISAAPIVSQSLTDGVPELILNANYVMKRLNNLIANNEDSIRNVVKNTEEFSKALADKKGDISDIIDDAKSLTSSLKATAAKIDGAVDKVSGFFGSEGDSVLDDARAAAMSLKTMAENLEKSLGNGPQEVVTAAKRSLKEFELFARDGRKAAQSLDRVLEKMDQNPQSFIFGGTQVPEYNPSN